MIRTRIQFAVEGGFAFFPGLQEPLVIDSSALPSEEQVELRGLLQAARFFSQPESSGSEVCRSADGYCYVITVEEGDKRHTLHLPEPVRDEHLQALVRYLRRKKAR
jgi:hypothetical protein